MRTPSPIPSLRSCPREQFGAVIPFQVLTIANSLFGCVVDGSGTAAAVAAAQNASAANLIAIASCNAQGYAAFGPAFFAAWLYTLNTTVVPGGNKVRHAVGF